MRIIVGGCGKIGYTIVSRLCAEGHDVTIIDKDARILQTITESLDVMGVVGNCASYSVLTEAGIEDTDLLIAVTDSDELNLLCCLVARKAGDCKTIARVRNPIYSSEVAYIQDELGMAMTVNPEAAAAIEISRLLRFPSAIKIETFAGGRAELLQFVIPEGSILNDTALIELPDKIGSRILIGAVERDGKATIPDGNFRLRSGDKISIMSTPSDAKKFFSKLKLGYHRVGDVMIVGGGKIAIYLATRLLRLGISVKILDKDVDRCNELADLLPEALVICGDGSDQDVLREEGIETCEAFVSLTGMDEQNIFMSLFARQVNPKAKIITKTNRISMDDIMTRLSLDCQIRPKDITADAVVRYVRAMQNTIGSNVETLYNVIENQVEALEFAIREQSDVTGIPLSQLHTKRNVLVACIIRNGKLIMPDGASVIEVGDSVVIFTTERGFGDVTDILEAES